ALLAGGSVLQSWIIDIHAPLIGDIHLVTSLFFDIGVYLVVVGLVLDILRSLGAEIDRQSEADGDAPGLGGTPDDPAPGDLPGVPGASSGQPVPPALPSAGRTGADA
ncbi:MAG TPA: MnhB domain-containing protein, partial [Cellulomonas sp.]